jgi:hypothetical protein
MMPLRHDGLSQDFNRLRSEDIENKMAEVTCLGVLLPVAA